MVAVIVTSPMPTNVTSPVSDTVATEVSLFSHITPPLPLVVKRIKELSPKEMEEGAPVISRALCAFFVIVYDNVSSLDKKFYVGV